MKVTVVMETWFLRATATNESWELGTHLPPVVLTNVKLRSDLVVLKCGNTVFYLDRDELRRAVEILDKEVV